MFHDWYQTYQEKVNSAITGFFDARYTTIGSECENRFQSAIRSAVGTKGKRIRPILAMMMYEELIGLPADAVMPYMIGLEFLHIATQVHDDLPAADNDEFRSGELSLWKQYDETTALLVGDALQALGMECIIHGKNIPAIMEVAQAMGDMGQARGQIRDILDDHMKMDQRGIIRLHDEKTGKLIAASLIVGALLGGAHDPAYLDRIRWFWVLLGRAFQVRDDIIDYEWVDIPLGKTPKKDIARHKGIVAFMGIDKTKNLLQELEFALLEISNTFQTSKFSDIVAYIVRGEK